MTLLRFLRAGDWLVHLPVLLVAAGVYAGHAGAGFWHPVPRLLAMMILLVAGGYLVNDVVDATADREKRDGALPARGTRTAKLVGAVAAIAGGLVLAWALSLAQRVFVAITLLLGLGYSLPGLRLKERGVLGLIAAAALQRLPVFVLMVEWPPRSPGLAVALGAWLFALGLVFILEHQLEDLDADRRAGVRTWAAGVGRATAARARDGARAAMATLALVVALVRVRSADDVVPALLVPAATWVVLRLTRTRYAATRRLPLRPHHARRDPVVIHGAGLSGLVAAIRLAEWGVPVEVRDGRDGPGGMAAARPAVHSVLQDPAAVAAHLGLPIEPLFQRTRRETAWIGGRRIDLRSRHWNCLRGASQGALDRWLLDRARACGVTPRYAAPVRREDGRTGTEILATGHSPVAFRMLGLAYEPLDGWSAVTAWPGDSLLLSWRERWTGGGYAYLAASHGHAHALVFSRGAALPADARTEFERVLADEAGLRFTEWTRSPGAAPVAAVFERAGRLLAGATAGFIDPFYLSGVSAALVSGGVAALAVVDPDEAKRRFGAFTRTFSPRRYAAALAWGAAPGSPAFWLAKAAAFATPPVGRVHRDGTGP
jgi:4-hydroxybenzoate polyprenyltransferase/flavin-dependent dehydrogenase